MIRPLLVAGAAALALPAAALAHGDEVPTTELAGAWRAEPVVLALAAVSIALFAQGFVRLRRRGRTDHAGWDRALLFAAGLAVLVLALVSPLDAIGEEYLLSGHMLQHVLIGDLAPVLLVAAVRGPLVVFLLPAAVLAPLARTRALRAFLRLLLAPAVVLGVWAATYGAWHVPALYEATLESGPLHDLEHATFVLAGLLLWTTLVDPARHRRLGRGGRIGAAVGVFAAGQVLASILLFATRPLYPTYAAQDERLLGLSPLADQRLAGAVMMAVQALTIGTFLLLLFLAEEGAAAERDAREHGTAPRPSARGGP